MFEPIAFGPYTLLSRLAIGGMAELFIAHDARDEEPGLVVIKRILPQFSDDQAFVKMFIDEARVVSMLAHPNVVGLVDFGSIDDSYYIAMDYVEGFDVAAVDDAAQERGTPLTPEESAFIAAQVCEGLSYAHSRKDIRGRPLNLVHRDISPENIMLSSSGSVLVTDFGIAKTVLRRFVTDPGTTKGKRNYTSPEAVFKRPIDHRHDVFTVGIVLWQLLAGRSLLGDPVRRNQLLSQGVLPDVATANRAVDPSLAAITAKALAHNPDHRHQNAGELGMALKEWLRTRGRQTYAEALQHRVQTLFGGELARRQAKLLAVIGRLGLTPPASLRLESTFLVEITDVGLPGTNDSEPASPGRWRPRLLGLGVGLAAAAVALRIALGHFWP